jgi:hypothetical protein
MRLRRLVNILAMLGMLAHAGALVRHNIVMVGATLDYNALLSDLGSICHNSPGFDGGSGTDVPRIPLPSNSQDACAICLGLVGAVALIVAHVVGVPIAIAMKLPRCNIFAAMAELPRALHSPARGPPARA